MLVNLNFSWAPNGPDEQDQLIYPDEHIEATSENLFKELVRLLMQESPEAMLVFSAASCIKEDDVTQELRNYCLEDPPPSPGERLQLAAMCGVALGSRRMQIVGFGVGALGWRTSAILGTQEADDVQDFLRQRRHLQDYPGSEEVFMLIFASLDGRATIHQGVVVRDGSDRIQAIEPDSTRDEHLKEARHPLLETMIDAYIRTFMKSFGTPAREFARN